ncbi:hypothetical protein HF521_016930 [Silurus meridionalis]|uniref:Uncharacterized protein n=1 Tax=Silurus meridionalis TaxID=175797 RepID=A0A8T0BNK1_SILME|nr:hypothetical protein HF521_016930 [Silurus meridionalis]
MLQQRKTRAKPWSRTSPPPPPPAFEISTENRFAPLREPKRHTVILGDSIVRHVHATGDKVLGDLRSCGGEHDCEFSRRTNAVLLQCSSTCGASSAVLSPSHRIQYMLHSTPGPTTPTNVSAAGMFYYNDQAVYNQTPFPMVPPLQQHPSTKRKRKTIVVRDPNQDSKDIMEEIISEAGRSRKPTLPVGNVFSVPMPLQ